MATPRRGDPQRTEKKRQRVWCNTDSIPFERTPRSRGTVGLTGRPRRPEVYRTD